MPDRLTVISHSDIIELTEFMEPVVWSCAKIIGSVFQRPGGDSAGKPANSSELPEVAFKA